MNLERKDMMAAVTEGVRLAFEAALAKIDLSGAITDGAKDALDHLWPSQIAAAIREGVTDAMEQQVK